MEELKYGDPERPHDGLTCEDDDWDDDPISEQEDIRSEEISIVYPSCVVTKNGRFLP